MAKSKKSAVAAPKPKSDAYTMMLFITLLAIGIGCTLLYLDYEEYGKQQPPKETVVAVPKLGDAPKAADPVPANPGKGTTDTPNQ
jgi:hypothetical protein